MSTRSALFRPTILLAALAALALSMLYLTSPVLAANKVTICHANSGVKEFVAITIDEGASTFPHLDSNGSPLNGHEDDFLLQGDQTSEDCFNAAHSASPSPSESASEAESVSQAESASEAASAEQSVQASGEQSFKAGEGTPAGSVNDSAFFGAGSSPLPTIAFSLILLASLGTLAYANVKTVRSRN
ncbi:MAG: hypothetical protein ABI785_13200 [Gemmatimonadales bacterium]